MVGLYGKDLPGIFGRCFGGRWCEGKHISKSLVTSTLGVNCEEHREHIHDPQAHMRTGFFDHSGVLGGALV